VIKRWRGRGKSNCGKESTPSPNQAKQKSEKKKIGESICKQNEPRGTKADRRIKKARASILGGGLKRPANPKFPRDNMHIQDYHHEGERAIRIGRIKPDDETKVWVDRKREP